MPYPPIEPYETGMLDTGDGNLIYWETCGNPDGVPVLIVHGGPGSGCTTGVRKAFDPERYRIILFDQRNCGRSTPHASDPAADMSLNTTEHLIGDMEQLREHLGVSRWLLRGGSWGVTLSLAYAERYPERVFGMILVGITSTRWSELDWLYRGAGRIFPEAWARFRDFAGAEDYRLPTDTEPPIEGLLMAYSRLMENPDPDIRARAASRVGDLGRRGHLDGAQRHTRPVQQPARRREARLRPNLRALLRPRRLPRRRRAYPRRRQAGWHSRHPRPGAQ